MKLCYLAAANSVHSHRWIRYFAAKGHDVHWISLAPFEDAPPANITYHDLSSRFKWPRFAHAATKVRSMIRRISPDVMHAHYAGAYGVLGALAGFQPFVLTAWGSDVLFLGRDKVRGAAVRLALRSAKLVTCDAYHMIDAMYDLGTDRRKIELICFGVEVDRFVPGAPDDEIISRWQARGRPTVISLRSLEPVYNIETLLDAVPAVAKEVSDVIFIICASGTQEGELKRRAADLGLERNVLFTGRYANVELPRMLRSAHVYVSTALSDAGIAASTAEAMACGIAAIVTDTGENNKWIEDGKTGYLVQARDSAKLADRIIALLRDPSLCKQIGANGRELILERDNYEREMDKMERLYVRLLTDRP